MTILRMIRALIADEHPDPAKPTDGEVTRRIVAARDASRARQARRRGSSLTYREMNRAAFGRDPWPREEVDRGDR